MLIRVRMHKGAHVTQHVQACKQACRWMVGCSVVQAMLVKVAWAAAPLQERWWSKADRQLIS